MLENIWRKKGCFRGFLTAMMIALAAQFLASHYKVPVMLFALLLGLSFHFVYSDKEVRLGIDLTADFFLKLGVGLLGFRLSFENLQDIGLPSIIAVSITVFLTIIFGIFLAKVFRRDTSFGILSGGSVAICGASAAIAICTVLPKTEFRDRDMSLVIVGVTILSTLTMIFYPILFAIFGMTDFAAGFIIGSAIHDVAQVVGAGYSISDEAGIIATFIKMIRVSLLPIVITVLLITINRSATKKITVPWFLILFFILVAIKYLFAIPTLIVDLVEVISSWLLIISIAAIGVRTSLASISSVSYIFGSILILETLFLLFASFACLYIFTFFKFFG